MLTVKVEATSANLCVGFDVLGMSLNLTNEFTFDFKCNIIITEIDPNVNSKK